MTVLISNFAISHGVNDFDLIYLDIMSQNNFDKQVIGEMP